VDQTKSNQSDKWRVIRDEFLGKWIARCDGLKYIQLTKAARTECVPYQSWVLVDDSGKSDQIRVNQTKKVTSGVGCVTSYRVEWIAYRDGVEHVQFTIAARENARPTNQTESEPPR
jgi:hypothetical protein